MFLPFTQDGVLDRQAVFDAGVAAILKQGEPAAAMNEGEVHCLYRGPNNTKCLIGHLIPDDRYTTAIENEPAGCAVDMLGVALNDRDHQFLDNLQRQVHDDAAKDDYDLVTGPAFIAQFRNNAADFAARNNLSTKVLDA